MLRVCQLPVARHCLLGLRSLRPSLCWDQGPSAHTMGTAPRVWQLCRTCGGYARKGGTAVNSEKSHSSANHPTPQQQTLALGLRVCDFCCVVPSQETSAHSLPVWSCVVALLFPLYYHYAPTTTQNLLGCFAILLCPYHSVSLPVHSLSIGPSVQAYCLAGIVHGCPWPPQLRSASSSSSVNHSTLDQQRNENVFGDASVGL